MIKFIHRNFYTQNNTTSYQLLRSQVSAYSNLISDSKAQQALYKFCFTGGPCAGKTTALTHLSNVLDQFGFRVFCVPETATLFGKGGAMINMSEFTFDMKVKFQIQLMKTQIALEDNFLELAKNEGKQAVILCDRGLMDGSAYVTPEQWQTVLDEQGWSLFQLRDINEARYEGIDQAIEVDKKLREAYLGHHKHYIIDNINTNFKVKIDRCVDVVTKLIGLPTPNSFFKKFLIQLPNPGDLSSLGIPRDQVSDTFECTETILNPSFSTTVNSDNGIEVYLRKRGKNNSFVHNYEVRYTQNNQRIQEQKIITARKYLDLIQQKDTSMNSMIKRRTCFIYEGQPYHVETILNVEGQPSFLRAETTNENVLIPPFIKVIKDVTSDPEYGNKIMASKALPNF
ncbi:UNKNOWN [Stylonychia lemnae]|uniref:NadR/Ttd14 AAA domain-containing protein n=1 Tax=Stylonychia lemnae TaxID=5949 RepID=A0A077ZXI5_STYLE|nr:UNKNOWN [Stylonychia lemnae]|eukprot:CDW74621.1 UNKNOWN [Stylonychia lemnae]